MADTDGFDGNAPENAQYAAIAFDLTGKQVYLANEEIVPIARMEEGRSRTKIAVVAGPTKSGHFLLYVIDPEEYEELDLVEKS